MNVVSADPDPACSVESLVINVVMLCVAISLADPAKAHVAIHLEPVLAPGQTNKYQPRFLDGTGAVTCWSAPVCTVWLNLGSSRPPDRACAPRSVTNLTILCCRYSFTNFRRSGKFYLSGALLFWMAFPNMMHQGVLWRSLTPGK